MLGIFYKRGYKVERCSGKQESEHDSYGRLMAHNLSFVWTQIKRKTKSLTSNVFIIGCKMFFRVGNELIRGVKLEFSHFQHRIIAH